MMAYLSPILTQLAFSPWLAALVAAPASGSPPTLPIDPAKDPTGTTLPLQIVITLTLLTFIPAILVSMTCFTRLIIVFHFLRQAIGTQEVPNNQILISLALFLTLFVMAPVVSQVNQAAVQPMIEKKIGYQEALTRALVPIRGFLFKHTRETDLALFVRLSHAPRPQKADDVPTTTLIPAFMISELKTAFQIGFVLFIPFLVIDLAVSSVLLSLGMMQVPPVLISTPLKLLLFVMVDGWYLIIGSLVKSLL
ncbi:MAG TPA: flagellar type III secretion system pore protein FliP [Acidobacteriota bacterium]|nr:flagellar type III secretion system pore protein FliP [Acidobacteriota bacterium]HMZ80513.1 flagellar type III secretion system pore protein FliP [Acidobacteriota bacterium]HNB71862.1 flagellar type III secretion system pore protein FliP [Acidobacteriota bacterium]HNC44409.1 flagellar type III secretion system pore protein FliP [Acidobacteriota bacterium]